MASGFPKIAVLLAAYNGICWIEEQLTSILGQVNVSVCVYISVDPSSDGTESWCAEFSRAHPNVNLLPPAGPFKGAARNFFRLIRDVDFSGYDYVSFSDQDDIWYPDKLERAVAALASTDIDGYSSNVVAFWANGRRMLVDKAQPQVRWDYLFEAAGPGCTYVLKPLLAAGFKKLIVDEWGRVQGVALHDWFCYAYARSHRFRWFIDPLPGMDYRQHGLNQMGVNQGFGSLLRRWRSAVGDWWLGQVRLIASLLNIQTCEVDLQRGVLAEIKLMMGFQKLRRRVRDRLALLGIFLIRLWIR